MSLFDGRKGTAIDIALLLLMGFLIFSFVVPFNTNHVYGDDSTLWVHYISLLANNFPLPNFDSCCFAGSSTVEISFMSLYPAAVLVHFLGVNPFEALNYEFLGMFLLLGVAAYYFTRKVSASRLVGLAIPLLIWSTNSIWNETVWGASYDRFFSLPLAFITIGLAYGLVSSKGLDWSRRDYISIIAVLSLLILSNLHVALFTYLIFVTFMLFYSLTLSWKTIWAGIKRLSLLAVPVILLMFWYMSPVIEHVFSINGLQTRQYNLVPLNWSWLFGSGSAWEGTLTFAYTPLIFLTLYVALMAIRRGWTSLDRPRIALMITTMVAFTYYFIEGWIPTLWPYVIRFESTQDASMPVAITMVMLIAVICGTLKGRHSSDTSSKLGTYLGAFVLVVVLANALLVIPTIPVIDNTAIDNSLTTGICGHSNVCSTSGYYRLAATGRTFTRWIPTANQNLEITEGRAAILDLRPIYTTWFDNVVFYSADQGSLVRLYYEDAPASSPGYAFLNTTSVAPTIFWMDWMAAQVGVVQRNVQPSNLTLAEYENSPYMKVTPIPDTNTTLFSSPYSGPIASETNAPTVGFFMTGSNSTTEYNMFLALLSYVGLGPSHAIPLLLSSDMLGKVHVDALVTDQQNYMNNEAAILAMQTKVITLNESLSSLIKDGVGGSTYLIKAVFGNGNFTFLSQPAKINPINVTWASGSTAIMTGVTGSYNGFLWKEAYSDSLSLTFNGNKISFYYAGPGMIYIPLTTSGILRATYQTSYGNWPYYFILLAVILSVPSLFGLIQSRRNKRRDDMFS